MPGGRERTVLLANVLGLSVPVPARMGKTPTASESSGGLWLLESKSEEREVWSASAWKEHIKKNGI